MPHTNIDVLVGLREGASSKDASSLSHVELPTYARQLSAEKDMVLSHLGGFREISLENLLLLAAWQLQPFSEAQRLAPAQFGSNPAS